MTSPIERLRQPDYYIGPNGIPRLTAVQRNAPSSRMRKMNSTDPVKLNKCLYNLTVRNGGGVGTVRSDKPANNSSSSSKIESDIAIRNQYSSKSSPANDNAPSSSVASPQQQQVVTIRSDPRRSVSSPIPRSRSRNNNCGGPPRTLLSSRVQRSANDDEEANLINGFSAGGDRVAVRQQCRFSAAPAPMLLRKPAPAIDNRLSYQRKYDRTIFGCNNRLDQFVLPPLQI